MKNSSSNGASGDIAALILTFGTRWGWVFNLTPWPLTLLKEAPGSLSPKACMGAVEAR
jgi:hypothetical protein